jgi:hypothetical protein
MYSILLATAITTAAGSLAQIDPGHPPPQREERLRPIPQVAPPALPPQEVAPAAPPAAVPGPVAPAPVVPDDVVLRWNEVQLQAIRAEHTPPPIAARNLAIVHAAIFDAVNAVRPTHHSFYVQARATQAASAEAAACVAAHRALVSLYPRQVERFDDALDASLGAVPDGAAKDTGVRLGQYVAEKMLRWRARDGSTRTVAYSPPVIPGVWRPVPPNYPPPLLPQWRYVTPFCMPDLARFQPATPPALTSAAYAAGLGEVRALGARASRVRTADQTVIALFWDDSGGTVTPPGHWNRIAQVAARQRGLSLADNARLFALLNVSLADAGILCWDCKYGHSVWRPITAIREADIDPDPCWEPLLKTPPFPSYTSGHSSFSGAAARALAHFFGGDAVPFTVGSDGLPCVRRSYAGFWAAALEAGRSRIYGGIHYEFDNREGLRTGAAIADYIAAHFFLPLADVPASTSMLIPAHRRR